MELNERQKLLSSNTNVAPLPYSSFPLEGWQMCENKLELEQKATAEAFIYGRLSTGIGKSVCYESLLFVHDFKGKTVSDFYLCLEATVVIVILPLISIRS